MYTVIDGERKHVKWIPCKDCGYTVPNISDPLFGNYCIACIVNAQRSEEIADLGKQLISVRKQLDIARKRT